MKYALEINGKIEEFCYNDYCTAVEKGYNSLKQGAREFKLYRLQEIRYVNGNGQSKNGFDWLEESCTV